MDFGRLAQISTEIDAYNALFNNNLEFDFNVLFNNLVDVHNITKEFKFDKLCEIAYKAILQKEDIKEIIIKMFNDVLPDFNVGEFCFEFIKFNIQKEDDYTIDEKIELLSNLDIDSIPASQIKIDYFNLILTLLLVQEPMNINLINEYNNKLKNLLNI